MSLFGRSRARRPTARTADLLVEQLGDESLVYDQRTNRVHCLSSAAARVWRACDGTASAQQLGRALNLESVLVERALGELDACELLDDDRRAASLAAKPRPGWRRWGRRPPRRH